MISAGSQARLKRSPRSTPTISPDPSLVSFFMVDLGILCGYPATEVDLLRFSGSAFESRLRHHHPRQRSQNRLFAGTRIQFPPPLHSLHGLQQVADRRIPLYWSGFKFTDLTSFSVNRLSLASVCKSEGVRARSADARERRVRRCMLRIIRSGRGAD